ncbi:MAG TPA: glycosyltransferase family 39 protein [bacterium]|nr:glycosyltransferase family 39 protein [bacterium]
MPFYLFRLGFPPIQVWDEAYHVPAARSYLTGDKASYRNPGNPPLGKELIAASIRIFGDRNWAHRLPSALSAAGVGAILFLAAAYLGAWEWGILAVLLWLASPLAYLHARLAMLDMPTALFYTAGLAAFLPVLKQPAAAGRRRYIVLACALAALGTTVKVIVAALFPLFFLGLIFVSSSLPLRKSLPVLFGAAAAAILLAWTASYGVLGFGPPEIPGQIGRMIQMQSTLHKDYAGLSTWQEWFLGQGSLWFHSEKNAEGQRFAALCTNNPLLWIPGGLAILGLLVQGLRGDSVAAYLGFAVPLQIVLWLLLKSQWILSYGLPMEPVFCLAIPCLLGALFRAKGRRFAAVWGFCLAAAAGFYFFKVHAQVFGYFQS